MQLNGYHRGFDNRRSGSGNTFADKSNQPACQGVGGGHNFVGCLCHGFIYSREKKNEEARGHRAENRQDFEEEKIRTFFKSQFL